MNDELLLNRILHLLQIVPREPGSSLPRGATDGDINEFEKCIGLCLPDELSQWLKISNGPCIGPGGIYGIAPAKDYLRIENFFDIFTRWKLLSWFPIAGDGIGNYYLLDGNIKYKEYHPIYFVDHEADLYKPECIVASNIWYFLFFLLQSELDWQEDRIKRWPYDRQYVVSIDPCIEYIDVPVPLPWS